MVGDGFDRVPIAVNRQIPGPKVEVRLLFIEYFLHCSFQTRTHKDFQYLS